MRIFHIRHFIAIFLIAVVLSACEFPAGGSGGNEELDLAAVRTEVAATLIAEIHLTAAAEAQAVALTEQAAAEEIRAAEENAAAAEPTVTPSPTHTPGPTATLALAAPQVSVSVDTNCRTGPGQVYDWVGALVVGEIADVIAVPMDQRDYVVIKSPKGGRCWLWLEYATLTGDIAGLPQWEIPATPTPVPGSIAGIVWDDKCKQGDPGDPPAGCKEPENTGDPYPANGILDAGEDGIEGIEVNLGTGACPVGITKKTTTDADGNYKFEDIMPGTYCVWVDKNQGPNLGILVPGKWSNPVGGRHEVQLGSGEDKTGLSFGWDFDAD